MKEVILNDKYKYVYDSENKLWRIHTYGNPTLLKPEKLFKFYDTNLNNIASLHEGYFWLSNPSDFNDPFDCNINLVEHDNNIDKKLDTKIKRNNILNIGVTCFTQVINEPILWAHYANNYQGFAIELNPDTLRINLDKSERKSSLNPVLYFDKFIKVKNTDDFAQEYLLTAKSDRWEYEKEWRLLATVDNKKPFNRIVFYEPIAIKAIYIGHRLFDDQLSVFNLIESIFMNKYPDKPIYIVYPHPFKLELKFLRRHEKN
jgi:hypothetical protein